MIASTASWSADFAPGDPHADIWPADTIRSGPVGLTWEWSGDELAANLDADAAYDLGLIDLSSDPAKEDLEIAIGEALGVTRQSVEMGLRVGLGLMRAREARAA